LSLTGPPPFAPNPHPPETGGEEDAALAEAILSGGWDTDRDLAVLVGPGPAPATAALRRLGQQRILWFRTGEDCAADAPVGVIRVDHLDEVAAAVRALGALGPDRIAGRALDPAHAPLCDQVIGRIERARRQPFLSGELNADGARTRIENGLANLSALCTWPSAAALQGELTGTPMVIVAPGPSLTRNIELLGQLRGRAILLALSHAVAPLRRAGVTPDFVLAADAHDVSHHLADQDLSDVAGVVVTASAHPHLFLSAAPRHIALGEPGPIDSWLCDLAEGRRDALPLMASGGSVAHTALALGLAWGCDPIGFVGLDLSFPGGRCYVESSADGDVRAVVSADGRSISREGWSEAAGQSAVAERLVEVPGWDGRPLPSSFHFSMCQRWFEETARRVAGRGRLIYNCSEGGAYIGGMRHIRLSGLAGRLPPPSGVDPADATGRALALIDARARRRAARERLVELMLELRRFSAMAARELASLLVSLPILPPLLDAELGAAAPGSPADAERRRAALMRWASWLEPRVVEAERALARQDRGSETLQLQPQAAAKMG
jgi:Protein of unknown function DUF115